jgi:hypothetical protein
MAGEQAASPPRVRTQDGFVRRRNGFAVANLQSAAACRSRPSGVCCRETEAQSTMQGWRSLFLVIHIANAKMGCAWKLSHFQTEDNEGSKDSDLF